MKSKNYKKLIFKSLSIFILTFIAVFAFSTEVKASVQYKECYSSIYTEAYYKAMRYAGWKSSDLSYEKDKYYTALYRTSNKQVVYCTEMGKALTFNGSGPGEDYETQSATSGKNLWIVRAIHYGYGSGGNGDQHNCNEKRTATQMLIHMISKQGVGSSAKWRTYTNSNIQGFFTSATSSSRKSAIASNFVSIRNKMLETDKDPSFTGTTVTLKYNSTTKKYEGSVTDSNKMVSSYWTTSSTDGATVTKSGNTFNISIANAKEGTITIKRSIPAGKLYVYKYTNSKHQASVYYSASSSTRTVKFYFKPQLLSITVKKTDQDSTRLVLSGAQYKLFSDSSCTTAVSGHTETVTTNSKGIATFNNLNPGTYYVKEVAAPKGYSISSTACKSVTAGNTVTFQNKKNNVKLYKKDAEGKNLPGATFGLYTNATCTSRAVNQTTGKTFDFANTDSNGVVTFEGMASTNSCYYLKEETPPNGYFKLSDSENCKCVRVNGTATFTNIKISESQIAVQKRDGFTRFGINGVKIGLFSDATCNNKVAEATTSSGQVQFKFEYDAANPPTFYVKELQTPEGYIPANGKDAIECKKLEVGTTHSVVIYNKPYGNIRLLKLEKDTEKPLKGIEFALTDENGNKVKDINGTEVANQTTNEEGYIEFKDILYGTYLIKEVTSDGKHKMLTEPIRIILNRDNDAVKLAGRSDVRYYRGDVNGDGIIDSADLLIYQNLIANPDQTAGLSPEASYALDVNGDGNAQTSDLEKDMRIVEYYIKIANNSDNSVLNAARNYTTYKNNFCTAIDGATCTLTNLPIILDMYNTNKSILLQYQTAQNAANEAAIAENATNQQQYQEALADYNTRCPLGPNTPLNNTTTPTTGEGEGETPTEPTTPEYDPACATPPTLVTVEPENVCPSYTNLLIGDVNHDCSINQTDLTLLPSSNVDLNSDGATNATDESILSRYIDYTANSHKDEIYAAMTTFINNEALLCSALENETCTINETYLTSALTDVGRAGVLPSNIARASVTAINDLIYIKISKQSITKAKEVAGATIVIRDEKGNKVIEYKSTKKPKEFTIGTGKYTLTEKVAPKGYDELETTVQFEVLDNGNVKLLGATSNMYKIKKGTDGFNNHLIIYNKPNKPIPVPDTGSNVAVASIIAGFVLVICGGFIVYKRVA